MTAENPGLLVRSSIHRPVTVLMLLLSLTVIGVLAYGLIQICASATNLPDTMFPDSAIKRPWDVAPLLVYAVSGFVLYPLFNRRAPSHFAMARGSQVARAFPCGICPGSD